MKKTVIGGLFLLMLSMALIVSCSQNAGENAAVGEELVDISFSTMTSRALTATREAFDEKEYVWKYEAVKDDATGLTHGQTTAAKYVVNSTTAGLKGYKITDLSQGYWNFTLYAYKAIKEGETVKGHSDVYSFKGTVTHQKVVKGNLTTVDVTVSPNTDGYGSISFSNTILLDTLDGGHISTLAEQLRMGFGVSAYETPSTPIDSSQWTNLKAGTYIVTVQVYDKDDPGTVYAIESKIVTVYTGLNTTIGGSVGELSAGIQFGEVTAEIIEATSPVIDKDTTTTGDVAFQSSSTIPVTASLPGSTAVALLNIEEGKTKEMTLTLEIQSEEATVTEQQTSKVYDISLMQTTVTKDNSTGAVSSDVGIIKNLSTAEDKLAKYYLTATLAIDKNLESVTVKHSGTVMRSFSGETPNYTQDSKATVAGETIWKGFYKYEPSTGILTIVTRSFSPFEVFYTEPTVVTYPVAVYDSSGNLVSGFNTMKAAVDSAVSGQTVKLLADVEIPAEATAETDRIVISKDITIDFGAYKLIAPGSLEPTANFAVLFITGNVVFKATTGGIDCLDNGDDCGPYAVNIIDGGTLTVNGGVYHGGGTVIQVTLGKLYINGGTFSVTPFDEPYGYYFLINCKDDAFVSGDATVEIKGGTFYRFNPADAHSEPTDPTSYLAEGYLASYDSLKKCYTVMSADGVIAQIGETYYTSFSKAVSAANTGETIEILKDFTIDTKYSGSYAANELRKGVTLDGNDHIISLRFSDSEQILLRYLEGSIKDLTVDFGEIEVGSIAFYAGRDDYAIEFKDVTATGSMSHFDGNCGVFVIYGCTNMTLDGCVSFVDIDGIGTEADYDGVFVGYAYAYTEARKGNRTFTFKDCINYGTVSCGHVGLLVGNMVYSRFNVVATDCYNYGTITEMNTDYTVQQHYPNIVYGATADLPWSTKINGVSYTKAEILAGAVDDVMNKGTYGIGSSSTLTISRNEKGSFEITGFEGAAYYVVNYGLYTTLKSGGSTRSYVSEKLNAPGTTQLKAYSFVDTSWAEANPTATSAPVVYGENTYTVYTLNDVSYYLINNNDRETLNGQVRPATLISVSAYSSTGKLLAAAGIGSSSSTVQ